MTGHEKTTTLHICMWCAFSLLKNGGEWSARLNHNCNVIEVSNKIACLFPFFVHPFQQINDSLHGTFTWKIRKVLYQNHIKCFCLLLSSCKTYHMNTKMSTMTKLTNYPSNFIFFQYSAYSKYISSNEPWPYI